MKIENKMIGRLSLTIWPASRKRPDMAARRLYTRRFQENVPSMPSCLASIYLRLDRPSYAAVAFDRALVARIKYALCGIHGSVHVYSALP